MKQIIKELKKESQFLISNQRSLLFDHLPKCGGTSITKFLLKHYPKRYVFGLSGVNPQNSVEEFCRLSQEIRWQKKLIYGHLANELIDYVHPNIIAVTVLREPIDRIVSHYFYVKQTQSHYLYDKVEGEQISLKKYCSLNLSPELSNWYVTHFSGMSIHEAEGNPEKAIDLALRNILRNYELIGFQDDIPKFVDALKQKLSLKTNHAITQKNKTKTRLRVTDLDQETIYAISQNNALDIGLYSKLTSLKQNGIVHSKGKTNL